MPDSTDVKPAFGQVWQWDTTTMMILGPARGDDNWWTITMNGHQVMEWSGIGNPELRRPMKTYTWANSGWELLSEAP